MTLQPDQIDWLQGEALGNGCPPQLMYRNGMTLENNKAAMSAEQQNRQREITAVFRRKFLRAVHGNRNGGNQQ